MILADFHSIRPPYETTQEEGLDWLLDAHVHAEAAMAGRKVEEMGEFKQALKEKFWHVGCKPDRISKRGHVLPDHLHRNWEEMKVFNIQKTPAGADLTVRLKHFEEHADRAFETYYPEGAAAPDGVIHVTCTGYASPSGAQKLVSKRNWRTEVTHAYHMGCYAAFAAIRIGRGFLAAGQEWIDVVHTELCTLHFNPSLHRTDQLVCQSLFADGFMKYSLKKTGEGRGLRVVALSEEIIPASSKAMTWNVLSWGFEMTLAKEVPVLISRALRGYLERLANKAGRSVEELTQRALFAIHPGGPKILLQIQELFGLSDAQMRYSFEILRNFGNMSSPTIPHIWQSILADSSISDGTLIVSMAFGPGLTISGGVMKVCG